MKIKVTGVLTAVLVLVALLLGTMQWTQPAVAQNVACFRAQGGALWACGNGGEMEFRSGSTLDVQSGATFSADDLTVNDTLTVLDLTVNDDAVVTGDLTWTPQTVVTITQAGTLTPTGSYQPLIAGGAVSFGSIVAGTAGDLLILQNTGTNAITITDTGTLKLSGNTALGQFDTITLLSDGTNWIEIAQTDN